MFPYNEHVIDIELISAIVCLEKTTGSASHVKSGFSITFIFGIKHLLPISNEKRARFVFSHLVSAGSCCAESVTLDIFVKTGKNRPFAR